ncbi:MAG: PEP-CTERM sorting domain-containing protein [Planctomycetota bacterium]
MKNFVVVLTVLGLAVSASAGIVVQAMDTTPEKIDGDGDLYTAAQLYSGGLFFDTPSGSDCYYQTAGQSTISTYKYHISTIIPDGTYTVQVTWGTQNYAGDLMAMNMFASDDALANGRISFAGGSGHEWHTGFPSDKPGWWTENIIGPDNWFTGIYYNRVPYESVTISGMQAGDLSFGMIDWSDASYRRIAWDTLEFIPEPATISLLTIGGLVLLKRRK